MDEELDFEVLLPNGRTPKNSTYLGSSPEPEITPHQNIGVADDFTTLFNEISQPSRIDPNASYPPPFTGISPEDEALRIAREEAQQRELDEVRRRAMENIQRRERDDALLNQAKEDAQRRIQEDAQNRIQEEANRKAYEEARRFAQEESLRKEREEMLRAAHEEEQLREREDAMRRAQEEALRIAQEETLRKEREIAMAREWDEAQQREREEALHKEIETLRKEKEEALRREKESAKLRELEALRREADALRREKDESLRRVGIDDPQPVDADGNINFTLLDDVTWPIAAPVTQLPQSRGESRVKADEAAAFSLVEFALLTEEVLRKKKEKEIENITVQQHAPPPPTALSIVEFLLILWRGKYIIAACAILAAIAGHMHERKLPDVFTSSSTFLMNTSTGVEGMSRMSNPFGGSGKADMTDYLDKIIQDGAFMATLFDRKWFHNGDSLKLETILGIETSTTPTSESDIYFANIRKYDRIRHGGFISIGKDSKGGVSLKTNANNPRFAYDLNMHILDYIKNYMRSSIQSKAKEKRIFIEERMREAKRELDKAEGTLSAYRERNMNSHSPTVLQVQARMLRQVNIHQDMYTQLLKQLDIAKLEELDNVELIQIIKTPEIPRWRSSPNPPKITIMACAAGLFAGLVLVLVIHQFLQYRKYVRTQAEVTASKV